MYIALYSICVTIFFTYDNFQYVHKIPVNYVSVRVKYLSLKYSATIVISKPLFECFAMKKYDSFYIFLIIMRQEGCISGKTVCPFISVNYVTIIFEVRKVTGKNKASLL